MSVSPAVIIYDSAFKKIAYLENATNVSIKLILNQVWESGFRLPANDGKNIYCADYNYAEIFDGATRIGLFRIMDHSTVILEQLYYKEYHCEHVLGKLLDDVIFGYVRTEDGGTTTSAINTILSYQTTENWILNPLGIDVSRLFVYEFENTNLLSALFQIPAPFDGLDAQYMFSWDDSIYPWVLNLQRLDPYENAKIGIYYQKNLSEITRFRDPRSVITRIYPLGYGDGENQLDISAVNPSGLKYVDSDTIEDYGVISYIWVDRRYKDESSLYYAALQKLESYKEPKVTYTATAADLMSITGLESDTFILGSAVRIRDDDIGIDVTNRIVQIEKPDIVNEPQTTDIKISNMRDSLVDAVSNLDSRQTVDETVSQGVLNYFPFTIPMSQIQEGYPVKYHLWLPDDDTRFVRLNKARMYLYGYPFRTTTSISHGGYISPDTYDLRNNFKASNDEQTAIGTSEWVDICESPVININTYQIFVRFGVLPFCSEFNTDAYYRLLIRDDPVTGFSAEYYPDINGAHINIWRHMFGEHKHSIPAHRHHVQFTGRISGLNVSIVDDTFYHAYSCNSGGCPGVSVSTGAVSQENTACKQRDDIYLIAGNYYDKTVVLQARGDVAMTMKGYIDVQAQPLLKIDTTPELAEPINPVTSEPYYPERVTVSLINGDGETIVISDYALDPNLNGGIEFVSWPIDFTDHVTKGRNTIIIECEGRGTVFGEGQVQFFQTTHA